ncbi:MAG: cation:proton antiporter [Pseudomonadota bacterium]|nr:cation:proton antiporter [Pseudomonadota bacterium]
MDLLPPTLANFLPQGLPKLNLLIAFGILLAFGTLGGMLAGRVRFLPTITGFMGLGLVIGPSGLGILQQDSLDGARTLVEISLGLILFKLGTVLHPWEVLRNRRLLITSAVESALTFGAIVALMLWVGAVPVVAVIAGAIAVSSSPAVLIHVAEELQARGPTMETAQALVAMNNVLAFILFSFALPVALASAKFDPTSAVLLPAYQLLGAMAVSFTVAFIVTCIARLTRRDEQHFRFALVVGAVMMALGLAVALKVSTLFTALTLGMASRWMQGTSRLTRVHFGGGGDVFFIILFVFAGANLHVQDLLTYWPMALSYVAARTVAKCISVYVCGRGFGYTHRQSLGAGLLLVPMAGLAIGLVQTTTGLLPELGAQVAAVVLAAVVVFETIGPPLASFALRYTGEAGRAVRRRAGPPTAAAGTDPSKPTGAAPAAALPIAVEPAMIEDDEEADTLPPTMGIEAGEGKAAA